MATFRVLTSNYNRATFGVIFVMLCLSKPSRATGCGDKTFRLSPSHNDLKPAKRPTKELNAPTRIMCSTKCYKEVTCYGFFFHYGGRCSMFSTRFRFMTYVADKGTRGYEAVSTDPSDCYDVRLSVGDISGVYRIVLRNTGSPVNVYCEPGGWLVIQRRTDGSEDFFRTWNEYKDGFGDLKNEFWLGNTNIHHLTNQGDYELRLELEDFEGHSVYARYDHFSVSSESDYFRLSLGAYTGNAGDSLTKHNGMRFSARDVDLDSSSADSCAQLYKGGWWYNDCHSSNLNGLYLGGPHQSYADGVEWGAWKGFKYSLKRTVMKIRPTQV